MKRSLDARLDRIEERLTARHKRERMKDKPGVLLIYAGESASPAAFDPDTGRGPLIIKRRDPRPDGHPISERERAFIIPAPVDAVEPTE